MTPPAAVALPMARTPKHPRWNRIVVTPEATSRFARLTFQARQDTVPRRVADVPPSEAGPHQLFTKVAFALQRNLRNNPTVSVMAVLEIVYRVLDALEIVELTEPVLSRTA